MTVLAGYGGRKVLQRPVSEELQEKGGERSQTVTQEVGKGSKDRLFFQDDKQLLVERDEAMPPRGGRCDLGRGPCYAKWGPQARSSSATSGLVKNSEPQAHLQVEESDSAPEPDPLWTCWEREV